MLDLITRRMLQIMVAGASAMSNPRQPCLPQHRSQPRHARSCTNRHVPFQALQEVSQPSFWVVLMANDILSLLGSRQGNHAIRETHQMPYRHISCKLHSLHNIHSSLGTCMELQTTNVRVSRPYRSTPPHKPSQMYTSTTCLIPLTRLTFINPRAANLVDIREPVQQYHPERKDESRTATDN